MVLDVVSSGRKHSLDLLFAGVGVLAPEAYRADDESADPAFLVGVGNVSFFSNLILTFFFAIFNYFFSSFFAFFIFDFSVSQAPRRSSTRATTLTSCTMSARGAARASNRPKCTTTTPRTPRRTHMAASTVARTLSLAIFFLGTRFLPRARRVASQSASLSRRVSTLIFRVCRLVLCAGTGRIGWPRARNAASTRYTRKRK